MKKIFLILAVLVMAICASAQKNQYFWYQGNLMMGNPIAQIDSVTFGSEDTDSILVYLPRTIIKTVYDTIYITIHDTVCPDAIPEGALPGEFSVSATKKVRFSKGNLQYQASTHTWRFAENQWNFVGFSTYGNVYENGIKCDNSFISSSYAGWIDLFGWGTGNNPTQTSTSTSSYSTFVDWGNNLNLSGLNAWFTLSADEWAYLFCSRPNAAQLFALGTVENVCGIIILPDDFTTPEGLTFNASTTLGLSYNEWRYTDSKNEGHYVDNNYSSLQWENMEAAGAVFIPSPGYREGTTVKKNISNDDWYGGAWSSSISSGESSKAHDIACGKNVVTAKGNCTRSYGRGVRLVQEVK